MFQTELKTWGNNTFFKRMNSKFIFCATSWLKREPSQVGKLWLYRTALRKSYLRQFVWIILTPKNFESLSIGTLLFKLINRHNGEQIFIGFSATGSSGKLKLKASRIQYMYYSIQTTKRVGIHRPIWKSYALAQGYHTENLIHIVQCEKHHTRLDFRYKFEM